MIEYVFLDAGGIILDETNQESFHARVISDLIAEHKPGYSEKQYQLDVDDAVHRYVPNVYRYIIWKNVSDADVYQEIWDEMGARLQALGPHLELAGGVNTAVGKLGDVYRLCILGQYGANLTALLKAHGLLDRFYRSDTQEQFNITKPDPRYFEQVLARAGAKPGSSVMVGDRIDKDVIPAKMIGMTTVRIRTGLHAAQEPRTPEERPDATIDSIEELPAALQALSHAHS